MRLQARRVVAAVASPVILGMLKFHTRMTGQERARVVIFNDQRQVLFIHEVASNRWSLPGGGIEKDETPLEAVVREVKEETGLTIDASKFQLLGVLRKPDVQIDYVAHIFTVTVHGADTAWRFNGREVLAIEWFDLDNLPVKISRVTEAVLRLLSKTRAI